MHTALDSLYKRYKRVDTYFVEYTPDLEDEVSVKETSIRVRGNETYVPGILRKTIDALLELSPRLDQYSLVIRSNLSTVINFDCLDELLSGLGVKEQQHLYFGANTLTLKGINVPFGIVDDRWDGLCYAEGTLIGLSIDLVKKILDKRHYLPTTVIDDVAIGAFLAENSPSTKCLQLPRERTHGWIEQAPTEHKALIEINERTRPVAWRNRSQNRSVDASRVEMIARLIIESNYELKSKTSGVVEPQAEVASSKTDRVVPPVPDTIETVDNPNYRRTLDLGCGSKPKNPFGAELIYGVDIRESLGDRIVAADLAISPIPFPDEFFDYCTAFDFLEHIPRTIYIPDRKHPFVELMNQIYRVLKPGGLFLSFTPAYPSAPAFQDPTHVNIITDETFKYFDVRYMWAQMYGFNGRFFIAKQEWNSPYLTTVLKKV
jgi:SAM-dependent methyltransferase